MIRRYNSKKILGIQIVHTSGSEISLLSVLVPYNMEEWKVTKAHITWG